MVSLFFTVCAIAAVGMAISLVVVFPLFLAAFGLTSLDHPIVGYLRWPVMFVLMICGLSVLYRYGPSRRLAKWRWISIGSVFAALAWLGCLRCSPGISAILPTTMPPTERSARWSA